ncbi:DUF835 domain-containing protein [Thermococcus alcaliphilus]|uniref:DUF835 domain-containing protein n=1 Tax=Thermococcus alcaliphilus TaxID=139207 RepID=UPI00209051E7|nr:DUF835 domain-containing protein [Thermococcus alcaliphilus]MCO6041809.1 DUF835 domain-containing protein [Thermococcus alcaliphilus]
MSVITATLSLTALLLLIGLTIVGIKYRRRFIARYPTLRRFYDFMIVGFAMAALSKFVFMFLDLYDAGILFLNPSEKMLLNTAGNGLTTFALLFLLLGWVTLLKSLVSRYKLSPVIEIEGKEEKFAPGVYLCKTGDCNSLLLDLLKGRAGLIVSRTPRHVLKEKLKLEQTPMLWLTKIDGEGNIHPLRLEFLLQTLVDFMKSGDTPKIILLDGIEYLMVENGFEPVFKFLAALNDYALLNNTIILVPLDESAVEKRHANLLRREFREIKAD